MSEKTTPQQNAAADAAFSAEVKEAKADHTKAAELYRRYVGAVPFTDYEERKRRINRFRCG